MVNNLHNAIATNKPKFHLHIPLACHFLNLIASRRFKYPEFNECFDGFVPLSSKILEKHFYGYRKYFNYFIENGIIEMKNYSTYHNKSKSYRFINDSKFESTEFEVIDVTSLNKLKNINVVEYFNGRSIKCSHLTKWFYQGLEIDYDAAVQTANKEPNILKRQSYLLAIEKIKNKEFYFSRKKLSDDRLHTNLTNLSKKIRPFLRFNTEFFFNIDLKASQPYFLVVFIEEMLGNIGTTTRKPTGRRTLMFENVKDLIHKDGFQEEYQTIKQWILKDDFYTRMADIWFGNRETPLTRNEWKKNKVRRVTYGSKRDLVKKLILRLFYIDTASAAYQNEDFKVFESRFPHFSEFLKKLKKNDFTDLSKEMQNIEAFCILEIVTPRLSKMFPKMPLFTIHDSIMTTVEWAKKTDLAVLIQKIMLEANGVQPQVNIEV